MLHNLQGANNYSANKSHTGVDFDLSIWPQVSLGAEQICVCTARNPLISSHFVAFWSGHRWEVDIDIGLCLVTGWLKHIADLFYFILFFILFYKVTDARYPCQSRPQVPSRQKPWFPLILVRSGFSCVFFWERPGRGAFWEKRRRKHDHVFVNFDKNAIKRLKNDSPVADCVFLC